MDQRSQIQEYLVSRRARITPQQAGLSVPQRARRVPGLRREEVATLAGLSVDYYNRLERGNLPAASNSVLDSIARALNLDDVERDHLFHLARTNQPHARPRSPRRGTTTIDPGIQSVLDAITGAPALVHNTVLDVLAANDFARALYSPALAHVQGTANFVRFTFLDPRAHDFFPDWASVADDMVGQLQAAAGRDPYDRTLTDLVGELCTRSDEFRVSWARRDVRAHTRGTKRFDHPIVGRLDLHYEAMHLPADQGLNLVVYTATPNTPSHDNLSLLATWHATSTHGADWHAPAGPQRTITDDHA